MKGGHARSGPRVMNPSSGWTWSPSWALSWSLTGIAGMCKLISGTQVTQNSPWSSCDTFSRANLGFHGLQTEAQQLRSHRSLMRHFRDNILHLAATGHDEENGEG